MTASLLNGICHGQMSTGIRTPTNSEGKLTSNYDDTRIHSKIGLGHRGVGRGKGWGSGDGGRRSSILGCGKRSVRKASCVCQTRSLGRTAIIGEHEREDLGDRVRREGFLLLYNRSLLPDLRDMLKSWDCCWETFCLSVRSGRGRGAFVLIDISGEVAGGIWSYCG